MIPWYFFALGAPMLWAVSNHIDKYIIGRYLKGGAVGALAIFAGLVGIIFSAFVLILYGPGLLEIAPLHAIIIILNGALLIAAFIPYFYALSDEETSLVAPIYQTIPVFSFILGFLVLGEKLSSHQIFSGFLIMMGAIIISLDLSQKKLSIKRKVLFLMLMSSFLISVHFLIFKFIAIQENFWSTIFWEYLGAVLFGIFLLVFIKNYRNQFFSLMKNNSLTILIIIGINESVNIVAKVLANFASLLAPLALVTVANGFQPLFVFLYGLILTLLFPKIAKEQLGAKIIAQKVIAIAIMLLGTYLLLAR